MTSKPTPPKILRNAGAGSAELYFYGEFGPDWYGYISTELVRNTLANLSPGTELNIHFNTEGGDVVQASAIYTLLKNWSGKKNGFVDGICWSCGSWVLQACDVRTCAENALVMVHDPEGACYGRAADMRAEAELLDKVKLTIQGVYSARSGQTAEAIAAAMTAETWYTAEEAKAFGLVDAVDPNKGPVSMRGDVSRFRNAPDWLKPLTPQSEPWKRAANERRQLLNELSL